MTSSLFKEVEISDYLKRLQSKDLQSSGIFTHFDTLLKQKQMPVQPADISTALGINQHNSTSKYSVSRFPTSAKSH